VSEVGVPERQPLHVGVDKLVGAVAASDSEVGISIDGIRRRSSSNSIAIDGNGFRSSVVRRGHFGSSCIGLAAARNKRNELVSGCPSGAFARDKKGVYAAATNEPAIMRGRR